MPNAQPPRLDWATPRGMRTHADFMHKEGLLKNKPASWKDLFRENMATKDGS